MSTMLCSSRNKKKDGGEQIIISTTAAPAKMRKGPWTDEEDEQLVRFVRLFGERRWDFLAKVSGLRGGGCIDRSIAVDPFVPMHLHEEEDRATRSIVSIDGQSCLRRTGKSCRLRWVNYLHPGLRRGRITADEERLIVELHAQWGSRWSRIARSLPGRTDNEIKNFWRTRTRKKALEERRAAAAESSLSPSSSVTSDECPGSPNSASGAATSSSQREGISGGGGDGDDAELEEASTAAAHEQHPQPQPQECYGYTMDQLWNEIAAADEAAMSYVVDACSAGGHYYGAAAEPPPSPVWEFCSDYSLWRIDDEEYYKKMLDSS